jgi:hypothetical protein
VGSYALIVPLPKLPTSRSPASEPKLLGAIANPQGEFKAPPDANRLTKLPQIEDIDEPVSCTGDIVVLGGVLLRIRHIQLSTQNLNIERRVACYKCSHSTTISADRWPDNIRLSDVEPDFVCTARGKRGAELRPKFSQARMGTG